MAGTLVIFQEGKDFALAGQIQGQSNPAFVMSHLSIGSTLQVSNTLCAVNLVQMTPGE